MAHKKAAGSAKNLRDSNAKYRWVKVFGGQPVVAGNIIVRQKGDKYHVGKNTYKGADFSIHAGIDGIVSFGKKNVKRFDGRKYLKTVVEVVTPEEAVKAASAKKVVAKTEEKVEKAPAKKAPAKKEVAEKKPVAKKAPAAKKETAEKKPAAKKAPAKKKAE